MKINFQCFGMCQRLLIMNVMLHIGNKEINGRDSYTYRINFCPTLFQSILHVRILEKYLFSEYG